MPDKFIYLSHSRLSTNDGIYTKVYDINFSRYSYRLLGGDLAEKSFENNRIISHLDSVFDLKSTHTLLSIGNHDHTSDGNFYEHTKKSKYGLYQGNGVSFIVLDSQDSLSSIVGDQKKFLFEVLDTITTSKVIVLSHKLVFMDQHDIMDDMINLVCNGKKGDCFYCHNTNNFKKEIYPEIIKLRKKGKEVYWIGGDLGGKISRFEYKDENGIVFLGNGFWHENEDNQVLIFENGKKMRYRFVHIDTLLKLQNSHLFYNLFD
ncbi:MAG: hypothetical protein Mars2KO_12750 [Maribacter sp.]